MQHLPFNQQTGAEDGAEKISHPWTPTANNVGLLTYQITSSPLCCSVQQWVLWGTLPAGTLATSEDYKAPKFLLYSSVIVIPLYHEVTGRKIIECGKAWHWSSFVSMEENMKAAFLRSQDNANGFMCALLECKCTWKFSLIRCGLKLFGMTTTPRWMLKRKATCAAVLLYFLPMAFSTGSFSKGGEDTFTLEKNWEKKKKNLPIFNVKTYRTYSFMDRILQLFGK